MADLPVRPLRPQLLEGCLGIVDALDSLGRGLDGDQVDIFGTICFRAAPIAHFYQVAELFHDDTGKALPHRAEQEQAFVIRRMLVHYLRDAGTWRDSFAAELEQVASYARALLEWKAAHG